MSQTTLTPCHFCGDGYPIQQLYEVDEAEGLHGETVAICGPCYDKLQYGENLEERRQRGRAN